MLKRLFVSCVFSDQEKRPAIHEIHRREGHWHMVHEFYSDSRGIRKLYGQLSIEPPSIDVTNPKLLVENIKMSRLLIKELDVLEGEQKNRQSKGSVLVFLPGEAEIMAVKKEYERERWAEENKWVIRVLHSRMPFEDSE